MRDELRRLYTPTRWVYGLSEADLDDTVRLTSSVVERIQHSFEIEARQIRADDPGMSDDILDDVAYYLEIDSDHLWHFCLWRLQAILEGMIVHTFLPDTDRRLAGLQQKLIAMRKAGYSLPRQAFDELVMWGRVRNALSHAPPEMFRPGPLRREDIDEYHALAKRVCSVWRVELESRSLDSPL